jgi:4-hydroxy-tetrahydrodipicolinate synthase
MKEIGRQLTAMVTPFTKEGKVDYEQAKRLALALIASGSDGVVVTGTTGESPTLTHREEFKLWAEVKKAVGSKGAVIAGSGSNCTEEAKKSSIEAEKIGMDGCLLVVPYYNNPSQDGLYRHFKTIAKAVPKMPCILYNVPTRTVRNLTAETVSKLSKDKDCQNIVGVKEASANYDQIGKIISDSREGFRVWSGNDSDTFAILALGGYGIISVTAHLVGLQVKDMINSFVAGDIAKARRLHHYMMPLVNAMFVVANPCPVKYALNQVGFNVGKPRLPLIDVAEESDPKFAKTISDTIKKYKIDLPL